MRYRHKKIKKRFIGIITALICIISTWYFGEELYPKQEITYVTSGNLEVHYIDVGQGDATLVKCGGNAMLIDAGGNSKGTAVQKYLMDQGVNRLDYVIATHPDEDHIGGLDVILYKFDVNLVMLPDYEKDTKTYREMIQVIKDKRYHSIQPEVGETYSLGNAQFTIIAPNEAYSDANNNSIGIILQNGSNRFYLSGDAEESSINDILQNSIDIRANVYKVAHHGSAKATTPELLQTISPDYAVLSCGEDNSYGHPHQEVLAELAAEGVEVFRTDIQGSIVAVSDGERIEWKFEFP